MVLATWTKAFIAYFSERAWRRFFVVLIAAVVCIQMGRVIAKPLGDFHLHWKFGGRLVSDLFLYDVNGLDLPYLPFWAVVHAPLSYLDVHLAQICLLPIFGLAAYGLFRVLARMSARQWPVSEAHVFLGNHHHGFPRQPVLVRDIIECGVNLALVALAWGPFGVGGIAGMCWADPCWALRLPSK